MHKYELTRRSVLMASAGGAVMFSLPVRAAQGLDRAERQVLQRMARRLYPHTSLPDSVYGEVLKPLYASAGKSADLAGALRSGIKALNAAASGNWAEASSDDQIAALRKIESEAFFGTIQNAARNGLYENSTVWELIGYGGPSLQFGGYLHRGFDKIDWLPEG